MSILPFEVPLNVMIFVLVCNAESLLYLMELFDFKNEKEESNAGQSIANRPRKKVYLL